MPLFAQGMQPNGHVGAKRRILVVSTGSLLDVGVERVLQDVDSFDVRSMVYTNHSALVEAIARIQPDAIILSQSEALTATEVLELLDNTPTPATLRIVVVHMDSNTIDLYQKKRIIATHRDDLVATIRGDE